MRFLGIDTSTSTASAALGDRSGAAESVLAADCRQSAMIINAIDGLLKGQGTTLSDCGGVACAAGPGSFTGLRVGMCTAKALAYGAGLPLYTVSSLQAMAWQAAGRYEGNVCVMMDARNDQVFAGCYRVAEGQEPVPLMADQAGSVSELRRRALDVGGDSCAFAGTGVGAHTELFETDHVLEGIERPSAAAVAAMADFYARRGNTADPVTAAPEYLRLSQAERAALEKKNG